MRVNVHEYWLTSDMVGGFVKTSCNTRVRVLKQERKEGIMSDRKSPAMEFGLIVVIGV